MPQLFCFFGNPGPRYADNRHNAAWLFLNSVLASSAVSWTSKFSSLYARMPGDPQSPVLLKPQNYYNRIGQSLADCASWFKIKGDQTCAVHDDVELPFGSVVAQFGGGTGGNNGLKSVREHLGEGFYRIRIGIGRPRHGSLDSWVLSGFAPDESAALPLVFGLAADLFDKLRDNDSFCATLRRGQREKLSL